MEKNIYWALGFIVGLLTVFVVSAIIKAALKKKNDKKKAVEYDERQVLARGSAYSTAFFTALIYMIVCALLDILEIKWAELNVQMFLGLFLSVAVFASISILKDAYFTHAAKKSTIVIFSLALALNLFAVIMNIVEGETLITDGMLNSLCINLCVVALMGEILVVTIIKNIMDKKAVEEE